MKNRLLYILLLLGLCGQEVSAAGIDGPARREIGRTLTRIVAREVSGGYVRIEGVDASRKRVRIYTSVGLSYYPFREENLRAMRDSVRLLLPPEFRKAAIELYSDKREVGELIPMACRTGAEYRKLLRKKKIVPLSLIHIFHGQRDAAAAESEVHGPFDREVLLRDLVQPHDPQIGDAHGHGLRNVVVAQVEHLHRESVGAGDEFALAFGDADACFREQVDALLVESAFGLNCYSQHVCLLFFRHPPAEQT